MLFIVSSLCDGDTHRKVSRSLWKENVNIRYKFLFFFFLRGRSFVDSICLLQELFGGQGVQVLAEYLRRNPDQITSPLGHHQLLLAAVDCVWSDFVVAFLHGYSLLMV